ncbi:MAG: hypothetical protein D6718_11145 [Acidobacteria bacterium]|nr:MAG: hypothetical protein D6718_11145 [Acidobacteriota bacterium]
MTRALVWKEWTQFRTLRALGVGLALAFPPFVFVLAAAGRHGWLPGLARAIGDRELHLSIVPGALALGLWPLWATLAAIQSFSAERAGGTEIFLLARPVSRKRLWAIRLSVVVASTLAIALLSTLAWVVLARIAGGFSPATTLLSIVEWLRPAGELLILGIGCGALAASSGLSSMGALAGAALLGGFAAAVSVAGGALFVPVHPAGLGLQEWIALALAAVFLGTSFTMQSSGEPLGRGRWVRGAATLAVGLSLTAAGTLVAVPLQLRRQASVFEIDTEVFPSPDGERAVVLTRSGAWLLDVPSGRKLAFFPGASSFDWNRDGSLFAFLSDVGPFGMKSSAEQLRISDRDGRLVRPPVHLEPLDTWRELRWAEGTVLLQASTWSQAWLDVVGPRPDSTLKRLATVGVPWGVRIAGRAADGSAYLSLAMSPRRRAASGLTAEAEEEATGEPGLVFGLYRVDPAAETIDDTPLVIQAGTGVLSRSGELWLQRLTLTEGFVVREVPGGRVVRRAESAALSPEPTWLAGDRLAWVGREDDGWRTLFLAEPGQPPVELARWRNDSGRVVPSPDGTMLLLETRKFLGDGRQEIRALLFDTNGRKVWERVGGRRFWAGPRTLAVVEPPHLMLESVGEPAARVEAF